MSTASLVLMCALELLGRKPEQLPPIEILLDRPRAVSSSAAAFADLEMGIVYLIASASPFVEAQSAPLERCAERGEFKLLASVVVHEVWHVLHGANEAQAYEAQLMALLRLGVDPAAPMYVAVQRALAGASTRDRPRRPLAGRAAASLRHDGGLGGGRR